MSESYLYKCIFDFMLEIEEINNQDPKTHFLKFNPNSLLEKDVTILRHDDYSIDLKFLDDGKLKEIIFQKTYDNHLGSNTESFSSLAENHLKSALSMLTALYFLPYLTYKTRYEYPPSAENPSKIPLFADSNIDNSSTTSNLDIDRDFRLHEDKLKKIFKVSKNNQQLTKYCSEFSRIKNLDSIEGKLIDLFALCEIIAHTENRDAKAKWEFDNDKGYIFFNGHRNFEVNSWAPAARHLVGHGTITNENTVEAAKNRLNIPYSQSSSLTLDRENPDHIKMIQDATEEFLKCVHKFLRDELKRLAVAPEH